jgi:hypothetical protein
MVATQASCPGTQHYDRHESMGTCVWEVMVKGKAVPMLNQGLNLAAVMCTTVQVSRLPW